ncbi:MAG: response regulator [Desulfarculus sp.]|nr:response regulator [Desulfarculus sp.]
MSLGVLLVEDEAVQALALEQALRDLGHRVLGLAGDGRQACELCRQLRPDLVLMDIGLPGMDGIEAARVMSLERPLPVVLITAHADRRFLERARRANVHSYLLKPVETAVLGPAMDLAHHNFTRESELRREVTDLRESLHARKVLARAQGLLMDQHHIGEQEALRRLREMAQVRGLELVQAAQEVLGAQQPLRPPRRG